MTEKKYYETIGKIFVKKGPHIAEKVSASLINIRAAEWNLGKIPEYYRLYCEREGITKPTCPQRKVFISVVLRLYSPESYEIPQDEIYVRHNIGKAIADAVSCDYSNISKDIRQAIFDETHYEDIREKVQEVLKLFLNGGN